jgi:hypothetical protein
MSVCVSCLSAFTSYIFCHVEWSDVHEIWCGGYATRGFSILVLRNCLQTVLPTLWMLKSMRWEDPSPLPMILCSNQCHLPELMTYSSRTDYVTAIDGAIDRMNTFENDWSNFLQISYVVLLIGILNTCKEITVSNMWCRECLYALFTPKHAHPVSFSFFDPL